LARLCGDDANVDAAQTTSPGDDGLAPARQILLRDEVDQVGREGRGVREVCEEMDNRDTVREK